jgi:Crinkler effector protein N-terminal domain
MSGLLELNYWIVGDEPHARSVFPLKIAITESAGALKALIISENEDLHNTARYLTIWKVSIPIDDSFEEKLRKIDLTNELFSTARLSKEFLDEPEEGHLHIIVRPRPRALYPSIHIFYFAHGGTASRSKSVRWTAVWHPCTELLG